MVYDAARGHVVLFGGAGPAPGGSGNVALGDTWAWDGVNWRRLSADGPARVFHAMAYDGARREVVLVGGLVLSPLTSWPTDTWTWNGVAWRRRNPANSPPGRHLSSMAYDEVKR